ncbi:hypothetical protein BLS_007269 [Venturia inaequalis]|uniref:Uncharacterized protein n=1 Tax=Venturia inaequalis TaxID=5025 RepID=A0A8H3UC52_VENIN|nr:hypothetical protein BLS_007269 [Venturia inaequalis]RDI84018.1 hypothetical protein Vi05172_g5934 [Venturia inaequalis]
MLPKLHSFLLLFTLPTISQCAAEYQSPAESIDELNPILNGAPESNFYALASNTSSTLRYPFALKADKTIPLDGYERLAEIEIDGQSWAVHEDLSNRNGQIVFASKAGEQRILPKTAELSAPRADARYPYYAGLNISEVGLALDDLLATKLLQNGEPDEDLVRSTIPPILRGRVTWTSIIGNVQANDVMAVFAFGSTRSFQPTHTMPELGKYTSNRTEGFVGGWMPAVRKVFPVPDGENEYFETILFGDVEAPDPFQIQTWHRMAHFSKGKVVNVTFGHSYPTFSKVQGGPEPAAFYRALFKFGEYWQKHLADKVVVSLPDQSWSDMVSYAFVKELITRPGGVYPKYGAFDRDYAGSEYDGFQDVFTTSLSANLDWGRFEQAKAVLENYYTLFVSPRGDIAMRGPQAGQFGLMLSLLAKYALYTGDTATLEKYKSKIVATAGVVVKLHDEALALPKSDAGYGLIHGWSESDAALKADPGVYWKPYYANSALTARGLKDLSSLPLFAAESADWLRRSKLLVDRTVESLRASIFPGTNPPYLPPMPGVKKTFRVAMAAAPNSSEQEWPHRLYTELLHANILPNDLQNQIHNTCRAYGATSMGVVANVAPTPYPDSRDILGFISYGYALSLLYQDRIDEFVLFLYTHRYHVHTRGAWNAAEVAQTDGLSTRFCNPAQLTIPSIVRWALVLEHQDLDVDKLYLGRGVPRTWLATGRDISIKGAPTRWGKVDFLIQAGAEGRVTAKVKFGGKVPKEFEVKLRFPKGSKVGVVSVNGQAAEVQANEAVLIKADGSVKEFLIEAKKA